MLRTTILTGSLLICLSFASIIKAATPDYLPLQTGNVWVYKQTSGNVLNDVRTIEVGRLSTFNGQAYYSVNFFGRPVWLRNATDGKLYAYDVDAKTESLWFDFAAAAGQSFSTSIDNCSKSASIDAKATNYHGPFGDFSNVLTVVYQPGGCADAGYLSDVFLPYIGLLQHTEQTIAGPLVFDLVYSHTGLTEVTGSAVGFGLALDSTSYPFAGRVISHAVVRMTVRNNTAAVLKLTFPSGQDFDVAVRNANGDVVYRWSINKLFAQVIRNVELAPGESKTFAVLVDVNFPVGRYTAEANLATINPREYVASVPFDVTEK